MPQCRHSFRLENPVAPGSREARDRRLDATSLGGTRNRLRPAIATCIAGREEKAPEAPIVTSGIRVSRQAGHRALLSALFPQQKFYVSPARALRMDTAF